MSAVLRTANDAVHRIVRIAIDKHDLRLLTVRDDRLDLLPDRFDVSECGIDREVVFALDLAGRC